MARPVPEPKHPSEGTFPTHPRGKSAKPCVASGNAQAFFGGPLRSKAARTAVVFDMSQTCLRAVGGALMLLATWARADQSA
jgi:hypothetical protein